MPRNGNAWLWWWSTVFSFKRDGYKPLHTRIAHMLLPCSKQWRDVFILPASNDND